MRAIQKRTTIHIIGAFGIDNGDLIWEGKIVDLHFMGGSWAIFGWLDNFWIKQTKKVEENETNHTSLVMESNLQISFDLIGF